MKGLSPVRRPVVELKTKAEIAAMRKAGQLAGLALKEVGKYIEPGITTKELDRIAANFIRQNKGRATFVGYRGYPATICVSINDEVVHGIPGERRIQAGDVVSIDVAATVDGFVGDTAATFGVPPVSPRTERLISITKRTLDEAIQVSRPGRRIGDIGHAVQSLAEAEGFGVVRDFVGHGIGRQMHEEPAVPNYGSPGSGLRLESGLALAIEPMITLGDWKVKVLNDGWTVVTVDGSLAAHFEHTIAVTEDGPQVLTRVEG